MNILDLVPLGWFSADMNVFSDGVLLAELHFSRWRENGSIVSESRHYAVHKDVMFSNRFLLEIDGRSYCQAQFKTSWTRTVSMEYEGGSCPNLNSIWVFESPWNMRPHKNSGHFFGGENDLWCSRNCLQ
jgi:hypothetical protein